jgi:hypothetical protein
MLRATLPPGLSEQILHFQFSTLPIPLLPGLIGGFGNSQPLTDLLALAEYCPDGRNCRDQPD